MGTNRFKSFRFKKVSKYLKKTPARLLMAVFFVLLGVLTFYFPQIYRNSQKASSPKVIQSESKSLNLPDQNNPIKIDAKLLSFDFPAQQPSRIIISALNIDLPVVEAKVVEGFWETSETSASHGVGSANPGQIGNMVIFAHARKGLFLTLREIKENDLVYVLTKDRWFKYKVTEKKEVKPDQKEVIEQTEDETLTLYTCSGFLDSKRLVVTAKPF